MNKRQINALLREIYKREWPNYAFVGGTDIHQMCRKSRSRSSKKKLAQLDSWLRAYDEYVGWTLSSIAVLYEKIKREDSQTIDYDRSIFILTTKLLSDLIAIRNLCTDGFDVQAKIITRSAIEYIDTIIAIANKPEIAMEFSKTDDTVLANKFWHKYVSKGKLKPIQIESLKKIFNDKADSEGFLNWIYGLDPVLNAAVHPNFLAAQFSTLVIGSDTKDDWIGFLGDKGNISCDTLHCMIIHIWKLILCVRQFPFKNHTDGEEIEFDASDPLHCHAKYGSNILFYFTMIILSPHGGGLSLGDYDVTNIWPATLDASGEQLEEAVN